MQRISFFPANHNGFLYHLDARIKLVSLLVLLIGLAILRSPSLLQTVSYFLGLLLTALLARLPALKIIFTSILVFPLVGFFAFTVYLAGDPVRAWGVLIKSYLSALTVLTCMSSTPLPDFISAAIFFKFPRFLLEVTQLVYRYFFVLTEQVKSMQTAFQARGGNRRQFAFSAFSGMIAVLFSRSYQKATVVNSAMVSRGYTGCLPAKSFPRLRFQDWSALVIGVSFAAGLQFMP